MSWGQQVQASTWASQWLGLKKGPKDSEGQQAETLASTLGATNLLQLD